MKENLGFEDLLFQTRTCPICKGEEIAKMPGDDEPKVCPDCRGAGVVIDNAIPEIIKKIIPEMNRKDFVGLIMAIMGEVDNKLKDAYLRGVKYGKEETAKQIETK